MHGWVDVRLEPRLQPLFQAILRSIPAPQVDAMHRFQLLVTTLGYDDYRGVTAVAPRSYRRVEAGQSCGTHYPERARVLPDHAPVTCTSSRAWSGLEVPEANPQRHLS